MIALTDTIAITMLAGCGVGFVCSALAALACSLQSQSCRANLLWRVKRYSPTKFAVLNEEKSNTTVRADRVREFVNSAELDEFGEIADLKQACRSWNMRANWALVSALVWLLGSGAVISLVFLKVLFQKD